MIAAMGAWGPGIFSDDLACDVRSDYRDLLEDRVPDDEATQRVIATYLGLDADEMPVMWLALAAAQSQAGRLDHEVKARALEVMDTGQGLQVWEEAGPRELAARTAALERLRGQLTGPQPARRTVRRRWKSQTDLVAGDVLSYVTDTGAMTLLRVLLVDDHRLGANPIIEWLDWSGTSPPESDAVAQLTARLQTYWPGLPPRPTTFLVLRSRKKDPDWSDCGFERIYHLPPRPHDSEAAGWMSTSLSWVALAKDLTRHLHAEKRPPGA